jgi:hypothetical protein
MDSDSSPLKIDRVEHRSQTKAHHHTQTLWTRTLSNTCNILAEQIYLPCSCLSDDMGEAIKRGLKCWDMLRDLCLDRSAWKVVIDVPEP